MFNKSLFLLDEKTIPSHTFFDKESVSKRPHYWIKSKCIKSFRL